MSQWEGSAFILPPSLREEAQRGVQQCCIVGFILVLKIADERFLVYFSHPHGDTRIRLWYTIFISVLTSWFITCSECPFCQAVGHLLLRVFDKETGFSGMILPEVQHPTNARKRFPQPTALLEMLFSITNPMQLQSATLTRTRSSVGLIGMSTHEECGTSEIAN